MSNVFDLSKKVEFVLTKRKIPNTSCEVCFVSDVSGSMRTLYYNGTMQNIYERIFAISLKVDKDKKVDSFIFDDDYKQINSITENNIENYVNNNIIKQKDIWGMTDFYGVIKKVTNNYFPTNLFGLFKPKVNPVMVNFLTDGETSNESNIESFLEKNSDKNIYWNFIGIGCGANFSFIEKLGEKFDNVGFTKIGDISKISDEDLYSEIINEEFACWISVF